MDRVTYTDPTLQQRITEIARERVESPTGSVYLSTSGLRDQTRAEFGDERRGTGAHLSKADMVLASNIGKVLARVEWAQKWSERTWIVDPEKLSEE